MPNLMGKQADAAEQDAENAGFRTQVKTVIDDDNPEGIVVSQSYSEGTLLERGTTIVISVAKHSPPKPSPTPTPTGPASSTSPSPTPGKPGG
ncbi:PASTA domain-containing protein [Microlunatus sp. Gsoil 973]|nr:PASTA domain-containing protein [Microlunatus sp. Gsoil 973]